VQRALEKRSKGSKPLAAEKLARSGKIEGTFDARLRTALEFLAKPYATRQKGGLDDHRVVLKLTLADRLRLIGPHAVVQV
jgi:hypothetical protein